METQVPCDLCGVTEAHILPQAKTYGSGGVYVCAGCGFVHVKERRPPAEVAAAWDDIYGEGYTSAWQHFRKDRRFQQHSTDWMDSSRTKRGRSHDSFNGERFGRIHSC